MRLTADDIYKIRKVYRLTQAELGALLGVTASYINQIEHRQKPVTQRIAERLTHELALTPAKLAMLLAIYDEYDGSRLGRRAQAI